MRLIIRTSTTVWGLGVMIAALFLVTLFFIQNARVDAAPGSGRLLTIHDRGEQKVLLSEATTVGDALKEAGVTVDARDAVEPAIDEKLVASEYQVNIYRARPVTVVDGPTRQKIITPYQTAEQIAKDAGVTLYPEDTTTLKRSDNLLAGGAGLELKIDRATAFHLTLYGTSSVARTQGSTVADMLKEKGIKIGVHDRVSVPLTTRMTADITIEVWREGKQTITVQEAVAFETQQIRDADRELGYKAIQTAGVAGSRSVTYEVDIKDGVIVSRTEIASIAITAATKQIEVIGAKFRGAYTTPSENESITWSFLMAQGFTREQTAGIMGNLMQEHRFNTTGDGLAQWTGSRKANLMSRDDPYNINTQLAFMMEELNGGYKKAQNAIRASVTVEQSVVAFQNLYEGCGVCMQDNRVQYAHNILASH